MISQRKPSGFSIIEVVIVLVVVGIIGTLGYVAYHHLQGKDKTATTTNQVSTQSPTASDVASAPSIKSTSDLDNALSALNQTNPDGSNSNDSTQLNSELTGF